MKLLGSTKNKITKDKIQEYYIRLFQVNPLVAY